MMARNRSRIWVWAACCFLTAGTTTLHAREKAWEYDAYRIQLWITRSPELPLGDGFQQRLISTVMDKAYSDVGAPWDLSHAEPPEALRVDMQLDMELITAKDIEEHAAESLKFDKLLLLNLGANPREYVIQARELNCRTRTWGPMIRRSVRQPGAIIDTAFDALVSAFAPLVRIEDGEGKRLVVRVRAGGLVLDAESPAYIGKDDILQPIIRNNDRVGKPSNITIVEWTYLHVDKRNEINPNVLECYVHSGWRSPIRGRGGSRREQYALTVRPTHGSTILQLDSKAVRGQRPYSLPGLEVYAVRPNSNPPKTAEERAKAAKREPPKFLGYTDWRGIIKIDPIDMQMRLVYIKNGGQLLARLPVVPGLFRQELAEVADDDPRLQAEGFIKGFNGELMDLVAQRRILQALIEKRIADGKLDEAEEFMGSFRALKNRSDMTRDLDQQQSRQQVSPNRSVQSRIDNLYAETRRALGKYLEPDLGNKLMRQLNAAKAGGQ